MDEIISKIKDRSAEVESGCWEWQRYTDGRYGLLHVAGKEEKAHRMSYRAFKGEIPKGAHICHSCDNTLCVNPDHLFLGTARDNMADMVKKDRNKGKHKYPTEVLLSLKGKGIKEIMKFGYSHSHASRLNRGLVAKHLQNQGRL